MMQRARLGPGIGSRILLGLLFLLPIVSISIFDNSSADAITNNCGTVEITYEFQEGCNIYRNAKNLGPGDPAPKICVEMPGLAAKTCDQNEYGSTQGHIARVEVATGSANVKVCSGTECGSSGTTCDVTFLKVKDFKQIQANDPVENAFLDSLGNPVMGFNCYWNGSTIYYTVTNNSNTSQTITWMGTPFHNVTIGPFSQQTRTDFQIAVGLGERGVYVVNGLGGDSYAPATTILNAAVAGMDEEAEYGSPRIVSLEPNPSSGPITISFNVHNGQSVTRLDVFDLQGKLIDRLVNTRLSQGVHNVSWNGPRSGRRGSGIYFLRLENDGKSQVKKLVNTG